MRSYSISFFLFLSAILSFFGCGKQTEEKSAVAQKDAFCLTDTMQKITQIDAARSAPVTAELRLSGKITYDQDKVTHIYTPVGGHVDDIRADLGDYVKKGQILAVLESGDVAGYGQDVAVAKTELQQAVKQLEINEDLFANGLLSQKDVLIARKEKERCEASLKKLTEISRINRYGADNRYELRATSDGFIVEKNISPDMQLRPDNAQSLFTISPLDAVWAMVNVYESDIAKIKVGEIAEITTLSYPDHVFEGTIDKIFNALDPVTRVMKARISLKNPGLLLKPEMFVNVRLHIIENKTLTAVATRALIFDRNKNFVMVYHDKCNIETRPVRVYAAAGPQTYLTAGLDPGEAVLSQKALLVYDALND